MPLHSNRRRALGRLALLLSLAGLLISQSAWSDQPRTYFVPLPDNDLFASLRAISGDNDPVSPITGVTSLTVATSGALIYWDQWENGYEANLFAPTSVYANPGNTQGTQIWGDRNRANGCPPIKTTANPCTSDADDFLLAGDVVFLRNDVPIRGTAPPYTRNPADDCTLFPPGAPNVTLRDYCYDGRDKIGSTFPLAISRAGWAAGTGTLLAGALEVLPTEVYAPAGLATVRAPVGPNTAFSFDMFQYSGLYVMAGPNGAEGSVTRTAPTPTTVTFNLTQGQSVTVPYTMGTSEVVNAIVNLTSGTAQVHLITGDIGANYESRFYYLPPTGQWSNAYVAPVGTNTGCTRVFVYNPSTTALTVSYRIGSGSPPGSTGTITVAPGTAQRSPAIPAPLAARFSAASSFYALSATDCEGGELYDWGHPLIPVPDLTTQFLVGWAPGCTGATCGASGSGSNTGSRSPLWITPESGTGNRIYIDYDGRGAFCASDGSVVGRVRVLTLDAGQTAAVFDDPPADPNTGSQGDYAMTGARIFSCDRREFAVAWGQDPTRSGSSDQQALDLGSAVTPLGSRVSCSINADKREVLIGGDTSVTYTFSVLDTGETPIGLQTSDITVANAFTSGTASPVAPPGTPACANPTAVNQPAPNLAFNIGDINRNGRLDQTETWQFTCTVNLVVTPPLPSPPPYLPLINAAVARSANPSLESLACEWRVDVLDIPLDFGDTPTSYGDPSHRIPVSPSLYLGATPPDRDPGLQASVDAIGDNRTSGNQPPFGNINDEDGVTFQALPGGIIQSTVRVTNGAGAAPRLCAWIDGGANGVINGRFDADEARDAAGANACQVVNASGTSTVVLNWNLPLPVGPSPVVTYARFRLTTGLIGRSDGGSLSVLDGEVEDYRILYNPTAVTIGSVDLKAQTVTGFLDGLDVGGMSDAELLALLAAWDPAAAEALAGADREAILAALRRYLDPDGDGQVAVLSWDTLEQRGTVGFYVDRRGDGNWQRINGDMLPALIGAPLGGEYRLADPAARAGQRYEYMLIEQEAWGSTRSYGPFSLELAP